MVLAAVVHMNIELSIENLIYLLFKVFCKDNHRNG